MALTGIISSDMNGLRTNMQQCPETLKFLCATLIDERVR
ncbi:MAG: hypothetical protein E5299_00032 [Burkholderia gladioli]|nr:MAG: hypothetical protein E5299_00032 [Burkholderia gladioli]